MTACSCGNTRRHVVGEDKDGRGLPVRAWSDGAVSAWYMGQMWMAARFRTVEAAVDAVRCAILYDLGDAREKRAWRRDVRASEKRGGALRFGRTAVRP